jgi:phosphatidylglycerophosphate synthase
MLDAPLRRWIDPPLDRIGRALAARGIGANAVTGVGLGIGLAAAAAAAAGRPGLALALMLVSRLADGLDGAVARATRPTDLGGFLDLAADFLFYGAFPLGFAVAAPETNALPAAVLLLSFYVNGATFLGYAALAAKRGIETRARGVKSLYYSGGLLEGTETILFFAALCLWPAAFPALALGFAAACFATAALRVHAAWRVFG